MPASIIAVSAQTGAGGYAIARQAAESLGFRYYDWEITLEAAQRAGVHPDEFIAAERVPSFLERVMNRLGAIPATIDSSPVLTEPSATTWTSAMQSLDSNTYRQFIERIVLELAQIGDAVIVGHAAQFTLRDRPDVLRILLHGSPARRAERLAVDQNVDAAQALASIRESDKQRSELLKRIYHFDWLDAGMYELSINTDRLDTEFVTETVVATAKAMP